MDWKDEEVRAAVEAREAACDAANVDAGADIGVLAIMTRAVELAAARGGTMTAQEYGSVETRFVNGEATNEDVGALLNHANALGARNAALEAEVKRLGECAAVTETMAARRERDEALRLLATRVEASRLDEASIEIRNLRERLSAAEEGNRELVRRAQQAEAERDSYKSAAREWERLRNEAYRNFRDTADERDALKARCATLSAAGQVLSAHVNKACAHVGGFSVRDGAHHCFDCGETFRWPCSPTCTHDDAATPGHPERVKERSEAVKKVTADPALSVTEAAAYEQGAEAMRAACSIAVRELLTSTGLRDHGSDSIIARVLVAIEGAVP